MSNTASDHLHRLITSLDKSEKRYFKLHIRRQGVDKNAHYELLFDALAKQTEYDEEKILEQYKGEAFVKRFSVTKNRLYNHVLHSLESFHANSTVRLKLQRNLHQVEILFDKRLLKMCTKILTSVEKTATEHELSSILVQVKEWWFRLNERSGFSLLDGEQGDEIVRQASILGQSITTEINVRHTKSMLFQLLHQSGKLADSPEAEQSLQDIRKCLELLENEPTISAWATHHVLHSKAAIAFIENDHLSCLKLTEENIVHLEQNAHLDWPADLLPRLLSNAVYASTRGHQSAQGEIHLERLRSLVTEMEDTSGFLLLRSTELAFYHLTNQPKKRSGVVRELLAVLSDEHIRMADREKAGLHFSVACILLSTGQGKEALRSLNLILNTFSIGDSEDIYCFSQMLHLLAHIDLGNREYLKYALKSCRRQLEKRGRLHKWEGLLIELVNEVSKDKGDRADREAFERFVQDTRLLRKEDRTKATFEYFDFLSWAENHLDLLSEELRLSA